MNLIKEIERVLGYLFVNDSLLLEAVTHKSYGIEMGVAHNERLEFLGDSLLSAIVSEYLFLTYDYDEGKLSKIRSQIVSTKSFANIAKRLDLGSLARLGRGEIKAGGRDKTRILCNLVEAIFGAIYLDSSYDIVRSIFIKLIAEDIEYEIKYNKGNNTKNMIQQYSLEHHKVLPVYKVININGPDHASIFCVSVSINDDELATGDGSSIREAEKEAARKALDILNCNQNIFSKL